MTQDWILKECVKGLEPMLGARAKLLWLKYLNARNPEQKQKWKRRIQLLGEHVTRSFEDEVKLRPPSPEQSKGEYQLGKIIYPDKDYSDFGLREDEWCKHMLIAGMTGSGKTNTAFKIIGELKKKNIRFLVFDWSREYKKLRKKYEDILVVKASDGLKFNPLIPPRGTSPKEWMMKLCDVVNHAYLGSYGTEFMMRNVIDKAYKQAGVYDGKKVYPTFSIVKYYAKSGGYKGRIDLWSQTLLRILDSLTFAGGLGNITLTSKNTNRHAFRKRQGIPDRSANLMDL
jgi:hypothetical protein